MEQHNKKQSYSKVSIKAETSARLHALHEKYASKLTFVQFFEELADTYEQSFCPECSRKLGNQDCGHCSPANF